MENLSHGRLEDVFIWEMADGQIAAVLNPEGPGQVYLQVHPGLRTPELEEEMLVVAEERLAIASQNGQRKLHVWASEGDNLRSDILTRRGYTKSDWPEYQRRRSLEVGIVYGLQGFTDSHPEPQMGLDGSG